nr:RNA-directed DNA polymerase, eukaryota, reverse transcriptase zinc-binding domain protein [Tanacetum cinerariifolium]
GHTTLTCKVRPRTEEELAAKEAKLESVPSKNSFQALVDEEMGQCCREDDINVQAEFCKVWPSLKEEVDILIEADIYPFKGLTNTLNQDQVIDLLREDRKSMKDFPWIILGDFNATLDPSKKSSGGSNVTTAINDFKECVADIDMKDITMSGLKFT